MSAPLVVIVGPTASGKSSLGMEVARRFDGEIICADSRTVYKGMDVGTAKPTVADRAEIPHHLLDVVEVCEPFNAATFKQLALRAIADIHARGKLPIMVGGTGLYVDSVIFDYQFGQQAEPELRQKLVAMSVEELQALCHEKGISLPENDQNRRHLVRAIEVGGLVQGEKALRDDTLVVGISTERAKLQGRIEVRGRQMVEDGIVNEVARLGAKYGWECEAMTGNIYRIFRDVVDDNTTITEAIEEFVRSDMRLAKRQMTWFKRNPHIFWSESSKALITKIDQFVRRHE